MYRIRKDDSVKVISGSYKGQIGRVLKVIIEKDAGIGSGFTNEEYIKSGAIIVDAAIDVFIKAQLIIKVKEPQPDEIKYLNSNHILFTFFHFSPAIYHKYQILLYLRILGPLRINGSCIE